ncbi:MAG: type II toxin-antitoxin system VapC family toxin [Acidimicrobiales bacterium]
MSYDYVLDASALVLALIGKSEPAELLRQRLPRMRRHAPHLIDAEVGNVLRRHEQAGRISTNEAQVALLAGRELIELRYPHTGPLAELAWQWRGNLSFYDALYMALAFRLGVPLVTADAKLSKAPVACEVEVV